MADFEITILGSGSATPSPDSHHSAQFIKFKGTRILLDCGEGTQFQMTKYGVWAPDKILLTHMHGDHILGIPGLLFSLMTSGVNKPLHIYAPYTIINFLHTLIRSWWENFDLDLPLNIHCAPINRPYQLYKDSKMEIFSLPLVHSTPTVGFLIKEVKPLWKLDESKLNELAVPPQLRKELQWGKSVTLPSGKIINPEQVGKPNHAFRSYAYLTDTRPLKEFPKEFKNVTVLYHEATYLSTEQDLAAENMHSTAMEAARVASKLNARLLLIGHSSTRYPDRFLLVQEARKIFKNTFYATEGMKISINTNKIILSHDSDKIAEIPINTPACNTDSELR